MAPASRTARRRPSTSSRKSRKQRPQGGEGRRGGVRAMAQAGGRSSARKARRSRAKEPTPGRGARAAILGGVAVVLVLAALASAGQFAQAQGGGNSGTIKVHDGASADPPTRNEPHVEGDAFVEGFNMAATEGRLMIFTWPPTGNRELVFDGVWEADGGEPANHFLAGPFELPCGHYRVEAQNGLDEDDFPGGAKSKMFWVDCPPAEEPPCGEPGGDPCPPPPCGEPGGEPCPPCGEPGQEPCPPPPCGEPGGEPCPEPEPLACPAGLAATPNDDGSITLSWTPVAGSDGTNVYRAEGDGDLEYLATVGEGVGTYTDDGVENGGTYAYSVSALFGNEESEDCPLVEVTAIPDFPTVLGLGLASGAGLLAYAASRRKA